MIDIHTHILPQMDDGSSCAEESAQLLSLLWQQGVSTVAATPHFYGIEEPPDTFLRRRDEAFTRLNQTGEAIPRIIPGAEVAYFSGIGSCEALKPLQLGDSGLLLVEMPFSPWSDRIVNEICSMSETLGLTPVLAHVDRYRHRNQFPKYRCQLMECGVYFQCNADIFGRRFDRRWALNQLNRGYIHFLGSDCHNMTKRPPNLQQAAEVITKKLGADALARFNARSESLLSPKET